MSQSFKDRFCTRFSCPASEYEKRALSSLLYWHAKPLAFVLRRVQPQALKKDRYFIQSLGEAEDYTEATNAVADFRGANVTDRSFFRRRLKIRVSGRAAARLARLLF